MRRLIQIAGFLSLGLAAGPTGLAAPVPDHSAEERQAVAAIEKLGGKVTRDEASPGKPVVKVDLSLSGVTDAGLAPVQGLRRLQALALSGTKVRDAGLGHLRGLQALRVLNLLHTGVTDAGLARLQGLAQLREPYLGGMGNRVTDAGLARLRGLDRLQILFLC